MSQRDNGVSTAEWGFMMIIAVMFTVWMFSIHGCCDYKEKYNTAVKHDNTNYDMAWRYKNELNESHISNATLKGDIKVLEVKLKSEIDKSALIKSTITEGVEKVLETNNEFLEKLKE